MKVTLNGTDGFGMRQSDFRGSALPGVGGRLARHFPGLSTEPAKKIIQFTSRIRLRRDPAGWNKPSNEHAAPTGRCSIKQGARCPPVTPHQQEAHSNRPVLFVKIPSRPIASEGNMGMVMVKCPQTGHAIPTGIKTDRESLGVARCFSRARIARSATATMHGLRGRPGSTSRASGAQRAARAPGVIDTVQVTIAMRDTMARMQILAEPPSCCCRPRTFSPKHDG